MDFTNHPLLEVLWSFFIIFIWVAWFWLLISITVDIFRRHDISGGVKALWLIFIIFLPFLGVLIYLITQSQSMAERSAEQANRERKAMDDYIRTTAGGGGGAATEIEKAKALLDNGTITQAEFDSIKAKALA
ncbi:MAG TPA: SHOCT domain-containing protein [Solirubrobacteraceae bacterium]|nr:SHOCT domain-containing protein [Solirubrobacteraceae bacterium]